MNDVTHEKYGYPGQADIIERNCSLKRIIALTLALGIIVIPVNAGVVADKRRIVVR